MPAAISIQSIRKRFGSLHALDGISFDIQVGDFFALLGPNGAGKTTLISILAGLNKADSGHAYVMGHDVSSAPQQARRAIGVVPQELVFDPFFSVRETLQLQSGYFGLRHNDAWIDEILHHLGLSDKANANMRTLSGGMKRRVLVGQALVHRPPVIVLDEPTAGVDVELRQTLWDFIKRLNRDGHTIVLTTHYLEEAENLCNHIAMLKQGRIIALDRKENLLQRTNERRIHIKLDPAGLPVELQPYLIRSEANAYCLQIPDLEDFPRLVAAIAASGATLLDLRVEHPSLEDVFVQMMHMETVPS